MPILIDIEGNKVRVPQQDVVKALQSGNFRPVDETVIMRDESGRVVQGPASGVMEAYKGGFRLEEPEEVEQRELQEQYGGTMDQIATVAHAAGNTLTFGALDAVGAATSDEYSQYVRKIKEANPDLHTGTELATLAASFLVPGGQTSAIAKATKLPRGVAKIGRTVEQATLKGLGGAKGGMIRQALAKGTAMGAGAGTEGAIYGAGQWLSEASLGDTEGTAENLIAHMKMGALWGGAAGASLGSGGELLKRGLGMGKQFARRSGKSVVRMWERATGRKAIEGVEEAIEDQIANPKVGMYSKMYGRALGEDPESIARGLQGGEAGKVFRDRATQAAKKQDDMVSKMSKDLDDVESLFDDVQEQMTGDLKIKNMGSIKTVKNELEAATDATAILDANIKSLDDMLAATDRHGVPYYSGPAAKRAEDSLVALRRHKDQLDDALRRGGDDVGAEMHGILDSAKRHIGKYKKRLGRSSIIDPTGKEVLKKLEDVYEGFRQHLEKVEFYGAVGEAQRRFNAPWSRTIGRGKTRMGRKIREKVGTEGWDDVYATNRGAVEHMVNDFGRARNENLEAFFQEQLKDKMEFARVASDTFDNLPKSLTQKLKSADDILKRLQSQYDEAYKVVGARNQLGDIMQKSSMLSGIMPPAAGLGIGYALGGEEGAGLGLALSVFTNPGRLIQMRAALDRIVTSKEIGIVKAIKTYIGKASGRSKGLVRKMTAPASLSILERSNWGDKRTRDKSRREAFDRRSKELTEFLTRPEKTLKKIDATIASVSEVAPNVATAMKVQAVKAARYLYDQAPKPETEQLLLSHKWRPSDVDLARFERIAAVIDDPSNALKSLRAGCLTVEEVEALKEVYPRMYSKIVTTIAEQIPELRDKLPYKERVQLSVLFDVPVDATMETGFLQAMQQIGMAQATPMQPPSGRQAPRRQAAGQYSKMSTDSASMTSAQGVEMRKLTA